MLVRVVLVSGLILSLLPATESVAGNTDEMKNILCHNNTGQTVTWRLDLTRMLWGDNEDPRHFENPIVDHGTYWTLEWAPKFPQAPLGDLDKTTLKMTNMAGYARFWANCQINNR